MVVYIFLQERGDKHSFRASIEVIKESVQFFSESLFSTAKIRVARRPSNVVIGFNPIVVLSLQDERFLKLLFIELFRQSNV